MVGVGFRIDHADPQHGFAVPRGRQAKQRTASSVFFGPRSEFSCAFIRHLEQNDSQLWAKDQIQTVCFFDPVRNFLSNLARLAYGLGVGFCTVNGQ